MEQSKEDVIIALLTEIKNRLEDSVPRCNMCYIRPRACSSMQCTECYANALNDKIGFRQHLTGHG